MITIEEYLNMSKRQRRALARRASKGNKEAQKEYAKLTNALKVSVNKKLRELKRANLDYGNVYNRIINFANIEYKRNRLLSSNELDNNYDDMLLQNEEAYKFLRSGWAGVVKARSAENYRIKRLIEMEALPINFSRRSAIKFLRWLGDETVTAAKDEYGTSDIFVEMSYDVYLKKGEAGLTTLARSLDEFLDKTNAKTFDEAMLDVGIKVEDYYKHRQDNEDYEFRLRKELGKNAKYQGRRKKR